jgi:anaerobic ribonucleoside-triphosphate reductase
MAEPTWQDLKFKEHEARINELMAVKIRQDNDIESLKRKVQHLYEMVWALQTNQKTKLDD